MLIFVKVLERVLIVSVMILIAVELGACGVAIPAPTATATTVPTSTLAIPTSTELPPTLSSTSTPTSIPVSSPPDGLRMAYVTDGNLYFQDGSNLPVQLTHRGEDWRLIFFSENGEKIFFLRWTNPPFDLYSINTDGSLGQALVTNRLLQELDTAYNESTDIHSQPSCLVRLSCSLARRNLIYRNGITTFLWWIQTPPKSRDFFRQGMSVIFTFHPMVGL